ncbi:MAG: hypothetical protein WCD40_10655 [Candidatus Acidiferrales bacterium]
MKEFCIFAANYLWPQRTMVGEQLVIVVHPDTNQPLNATLSSQIEDRNRRLANYKRVSGIVMWSSDFPRTAAMKIKRNVLAEEIRGTIDRSAVLNL